ncbi:MAG: penicillin-binding protein 1C [Pseudomonadota bacterium]
MGQRRNRLWRFAAAAGLWLGAGWIALDSWVDTAPFPDLTPDVSVTVLDRQGRLLRAYQVDDGRWRLPVRVADVDPGYLAQLIAYEDRRFYDHAGVDLLAIARAAGQALTNGRAVSGASTLTMQVARLLNGTPTRSVSAKLAQMRLALALERRLSKDQILQLYLTLAPFGGNIEGVRAASLTWFGKEPRRLTPAEGALLVALPQSPVARRPDRHGPQARDARDRVLARAARYGALAVGDAKAARTEPVPTERRPFPQLSPHLADRLLTQAPETLVHQTTLDAGLQGLLEALVAERAGAMHPAVSMAILVADHRTGEILARVGSPGLDQITRRGFVDMTRAVRSPGSTLKPLIYGLAFEDGLAHPESLIDDRPIAFGAYVPTNFGDDYHGTVTVRDALQRSLNVPAVTLLDGVGPAKLLVRLRQAGAAPQLPGADQPGLAIALGGLGVRLEGLVSLYAAIARGGEAVALHATPDTQPRQPRILKHGAAWQVADVLAGAPAPVAASNGQLAYKTGTSYGHRDAWAVGFDGQHVIGVWVGRPDAAPVPGITGIKTAAPILFEAFSRLKPAPAPLLPPPGDVLIVSHDALPQPLRHVRGPRGAPLADGPKIAFPPDGARIEMAGGLLALKVRDGAPPFTWLVDGEPVETMGLMREISWRAPGRGFVSIAVIDGRGAAAQARVFLE